MTEIKAPERMSFGEAGLAIAKEDLDLLKRWIEHSATATLTPHDKHSTTRDGRLFSVERTVTPAERNGYFGARIQGLVGEFYAALMPILQLYLGSPLSELPTQHRATGRLHLPGDDAGESHVDYYPSVTAYLSRTKRGGNIRIANSASARSIEEIRADSHMFQPIPETFLLFHSTLFPHYVLPIPTDVDGSRTALNLSYFQAPVNIDSTHPREAALRRL